MITRRAMGFGLTAATLWALGSGSGRAQTAIPTRQRLNYEGRYLPQYLDLQARVAAGDEDARWELSQYAPFVGDEATALGVAASPRPATAELPDLSGAEAVDALEAIVAAAADRQIVILNEAHTISRHRAFAATVLRALRPLGFDWFAAETFAVRRPEPAPTIADYQPGRPFHPALGYYIRDPVFAEAVREAARLGYRLGAYEQRPDQRAPEGADREASIATREEAQADNFIADILSPNPQARVFVYCGFSHAMEAPGRGGEWFAARLKRKTGIDPLTIEQAFNAPGVSPAFDEAHVAAVQARFAPQRPVIVRHADGAPVTTPSYAGRMDLSVHHPRLPDVAGRPGWLAADPARRAVEVEVPAVEGPALLQALWAHEGPGAIPADQFLLAPGQRRATLLLHPGPYVLRIERPEGFEPAFGEVRVEG